MCLRTQARWRALPSKGSTRLGLKPYIVIEEQKGESPAECCSISSAASVHWMVVISYQLNRPSALRMVHQSTHFPKKRTDANKLIACKFRGLSELMSGFKSLPIDVPFVKRCKKGLNLFLICSLVLVVFIRHWTLAHQWKETSKDPLGTLCVATDWSKLSARIRMLAHC